MVALTPSGDQGRGLRARRQHALCRDGHGARPHSGSLSATLLCPRPNGKRDQRSQTLPEVGSHVVSSLRSQSVALDIAFGRLRVARVQELKDRIKISFPSSCPVAPVLSRTFTVLAYVRLTESAP